MQIRPPVMLISGQLLTADTWTPQVRSLSRDYDLRFADHTRDDTIAVMAERLLAEAPGRFDIVAHAMGGFVAFEVLRRAPERVRSLALLATLASADGPAQTVRREGYIRLVEQGKFPAVIEERIPILVHPVRREDEALLSTVRNMALQTGAQTFMAQQRAIMGRFDSRPGLSAIPCPTLLIWGRQDGIATEAHQDEMRDAIPNVRLTVVEDCGHLLTLERPATVTRILKDWLVDLS
jgi:pimeloyl-ACP methyl ester carboxylesterase